MLDRLITVNNKRVCSNSKSFMKTDKNVKIVAISLPSELLKRADEKAAIRFQNRSEYIKNLILLDLGLITVNNQEGAKK